MDSFSERLLDWYDKAQRRLPWRLDYFSTKDPFYVWLSEVMLQQTVIKAVIPVYLRFTSQIKSIQDLANASEDEIRSLVRGLGYYRRFALMHRAAKVVAERGAYPASQQEWRDLPGIGRYTSAAVASICLNEVCACVDGNVERVLCRLHDIQRPVNDPDLKEWYYQTAQSLIAATRPGDFNQAMMQLGQLVCTPKSPICTECPVSQHCLAFARNTQPLAPQAKLKKAKPLDVNVRLLVLRTLDDRVVLFKRSDQAKFLKGASGFLTALKRDDRYHVDGFPPSQEFDRLFLNAKPIGRFKHSITHHRLNVEVLESFDLDASIDQLDGASLDRAEVEGLLVSNLDRKALAFALAPAPELAI